jgi:hypothetical protein
MRCFRPGIREIKVRHSKFRQFLTGWLLGWCSLAGAVGWTQEIVRWDFGSEGTNLLYSHGAVLRDQAGPRPPEFPDFEAGNTAVTLDSRGAYLSIPDPGPGSVFDFDLGDAITIEAWIQFDRNHIGSLQEGAPLYVVGKGRTGNPRMARDNQNWALRIVPAGRAARISFLFATPRTAGDGHWHRWTSDGSLALANGWHHIAVAYQFGEPDSIRGWIDGAPTPGSWDMGGATTEAPVVDDDEVWIGSANAGSSFVGSLDAIAIHREILSDAVVASRFRRASLETDSANVPNKMPELGDIPPGHVRFSLSHGYPWADEWVPEIEAPSESLGWLGDVFLLPRIPARFDKWGIRDDWQPPVLLRMAADVELAPGRRRFLMRSRGLGRLWVDGQLVASSAPVTRKSPDGEQPVTPLAEPVVPGMRVPGYHQQEVFGWAEIAPEPQRAQATCRVVFELIVGGPGQRTETGEVCVAVQDQEGAPFQVLTSSTGSSMPLTDSAVEAALTYIERSLADDDDRRRRTASANLAEFWEQRHQIARDWVEQHSVHETLAGAGNHQASQHPIDGFIDRKRYEAIRASEASDRNSAEHFHQSVLPILRDNCFRCHSDKVSGGLRLDSRASILLAGESELPAVVPGAPEASELMQQVRGGTMPPTETGLGEGAIAQLEEWIRDGAKWPPLPLEAEKVAYAPIIDDASFLRRSYLDAIGVPPTAAETRAFLDDEDPEKRKRLIELLLQDDRVADHWISYWQDVLAENPTLLNQSLGSTGPFRWFLYDALRDNQPIDRMVTELIMMRGSLATGGSAAFGLAGESDSPMAAKAHILASAFMAVELQCARCHDSPYHSTTQQDLYALAAMLQRSPVTVPASSRVPDAFFEKKGRQSLIQVTLKPDQQITPQWPFAEVCGITDSQQLDDLTWNPDDTRQRLAALITSPMNQRFARVLVNRVWKRLMGAGLVEPVDDWEGQTPSHPDLLDWLANEFVASGYDLRHVIRIVMTSDAYMRSPTGDNLTVRAEQRFFVAPQRRRMTAEQVVDSLHAVTGSPMDCEELTFVHDGQRPLDKRQTLGKPRRAWMLAGLNNERDRPSLSLPKARAIVDVLEAFGWNGNRQMPISTRDTDPNVLQPGVLLNGTLSMTLTRAAYKSELAERAIAAESPEDLVAEMFLGVLCRYPQPDELQTFSDALRAGFEKRVLSSESVEEPQLPPPLPLVTWFNHLQPETTTIQLEKERRVSRGPPVDPRLAPEWRSVYEDLVWALINHREFVWVP